MELGQQPARPVRLPAYYHLGVHRKGYCELRRNSWGSLRWQGLAQELRRRLGLDLFNFDLLHPSADQPGACAARDALRCTRGRTTRLHARRADAALPLQARCVCACGVSRLAPGTSLASGLGLG
jgi:hypothetical protein